MKKFVCLLCLVCGFVACGDDSDVFYSIRYDIVKSKVRVLIQPPVGSDNTAEGNASGSNTLAGADPTDIDSDAAIVREFDLPAGGSYLLEYTRYDGGTLTVRSSAEAASVSVGEFDKQPAARSMTFRYDGQEIVYAMESYADETTGRSCVLLVADMTAAYQALYPDAGIVGAQRFEYTAAAW